MVFTAGTGTNGKKPKRINFYRVVGPNTLTFAFSTNIPSFRHADLQQSAVMMNYALVGNATGSLSSSISSSGESGVLTYTTTAVDDTAAVQFYTNNNATWTGISATSGAVAANSLLHIVNAIGEPFPCLFAKYVSGYNS